MNNPETCPVCKTNGVVLISVDGTEVKRMCGDCAYKGVSNHGR